MYSSLRGNYDGGVDESLFGGSIPGATTTSTFRRCGTTATGSSSWTGRIAFDWTVSWVSPWRLAVGLQAFVESGAPLNKLGYFSEDFASAVNLVPRGSEGRLPTLWGTNLTLSYPIAIGPATVTLQAYLFNVFNKQIAIARDDFWTFYRRRAIRTRSTTRTSHKTTRRTGGSSTARIRAPSAPRSESRSRACSSIVLSPRRYRLRLISNARRSYPHWIAVGCSTRIP